MSINSKMTAIADEIRELSGKTGTMGLDAMATNLGEANDEVGSQTTLIAQIAIALEGKVAGGVEPTLQDKTVTPTTSTQTVTADNGYDGLDTVTVNAIPSTYIQPSYTKAATTYTPTTTNQTISAGTYLAGAQTIKGDANLVAGNIKSGVSIFGVTGTLTEGGSGGSSGDSDELWNKMCNRNFTEVANNSITKIGSYTFAYCTSLTTVDFPVCTNVSAYAFGNCSKLTSVSLPACTIIGSSAFTACSSLATVSFPACTSVSTYAFGYCKSLTSVSFPTITTIANSAFYNCSSLTAASFPVCTSIGTGVFRSCYNLTSLTLGASTVCKLSASATFSSTPIGGYSTSAGKYGSIYVPASLLTSYKTATNWTYFSSRFVGI